MRIVQVAPYFPPYQGGQERYVFNLSKQLAQMGHEVTVITSDIPTNQVDYCEGIFEVRKHKSIARIMRNPIVPGLARDIETLNGCDVVNVHNEYCFPSFMLAFLSSALEPPLALTSHGQLVFGIPSLDSIRRAYQHSAARYVYSRMDAIFANSPKDVKHIKSELAQSEDCIHLVSNALDPDFLDPSFLEASDDVPPFFNPSGNIVFLYSGRLILRKGLGYLMDAFRVVSRDSRMHGAKLVLTGIGEDEYRLRKIAELNGISDNVIFTGHVNQSELIWLYRNSHFFVLPSLSEVCPTAILEAMHFGLPVISTDIDGIADVFNDCAILVEPARPDLLAEAMIGLASDSTACRNLARRASQLVAESFAWERVAAAYLKVYKDLATVGKEK